MQFTILLLLVLSFFVFLFCTYWLARDDVVLIRKNITMEQVFNIAFLLAGIGLFSSRLLYVILHFDYGFLNPLVFLAFPHFPGLLLEGGILGATIFIAFFLKSWKVPVGRLFDFFSVALLSAIAFGFLLSSFVSVILKQSAFTVELVLLILYTALFVIFVKFLLPLLRKGELEDGSLGLMFLLFFSAISFFTDLFNSRSGNFIYIDKESLIFAVLLLVSLILLIKQEKFLYKSN